MFRVACPGETSLERTRCFMLLRWVFLAGGFYAGEDAYAEEDDGADNDPARWYVHLVSL